MEIRAAAPPPTPLKMATSCGMAVIFTKRATGHRDGRTDDHGHDGQHQVLARVPERGLGEGEAHGQDGRRGAHEIAPAGRTWASSGT